MAGTPEILRQIHRLRRFARDLQEEINRGPIQLKARRTFADKQETGAREAHDALKKLKVTIHDKEVTLKATHQQIAKYQKQLDEVTAKKQYDALQHEITAARAKCDGLEDEILTAMAAADEKTAQLPVADAAAKKGREEAVAFESDQGERLTGLNAELQKTLAELKAVEASLPDDVKPLYARMLASYGADALATVEGQTCSFCNTGITVQQQYELQTGQFVSCRSCYRGLYLSE